MTPTKKQCTIFSRGKVRENHHQEMEGMFICFCLNLKSKGRSLFIQNDYIRVPFYTPKCSSASEESAKNPKPMDRWKKRTVLLAEIWGPTKNELNIVFKKYCAEYPAIYFPYRGLNVWPVVGGSPTLWTKQCESIRQIFGIIWDPNCFFWKNKIKSLRSFNVEVEPTPHSWEKKIPKGKILVRSG